MEMFVAADMIERQTCGAEQLELRGDFGRDLLADG
jgi:hypothetical protein